MAILPFEQYWPAGTVVIWFGLALYQIYRDRYRTWTEAFFLAGCFFIGAYALTDILFFTAPTPEQAALAALISFSVLTLAIFFIFMFALVFYTRMRTAYFVALLPALALVAILWFGLVPATGGIVALDTSTGGPPWIGKWYQPVFLTWLAAGMAYSALAAYFLVRTYREVSGHTPKLRRRMLGLLISTLLSIFFGAVTNALRGALGTNVLPLFSTALALPGIVSVITLSPQSPERFSVAVRRWKASRYDIMAAFVIYADGTLIGAKIRPGEKVIDQDLFGATLDVIQNFMRTSFPTLRGALSAVKQGDYTLVMERGHWAYLTVVLQGEENDQLRRYMRDILLKYERDNQPVLSDWRGIPSEAIGTDAMLASLFQDT